MNSIKWTRSIIGSNVVYDDQGNLESTGNVYWFERYQIESEIDTLLEKGEVIFQKAEPVK